MNKITAIEMGLAPTLKMGWRAILNTCHDGRWYDRDELLDAAEATGIQRTTAQNLLYAATSRRLSPRRLSRRGYGPTSQYRLP